MVCARLQVVIQRVNENFCVKIVAVSGDGMGMLRDDDLAIDPATGMVKSGSANFADMRSQYQTGRGSGTFGAGAAE